MNEIRRFIRYTLPGLAVTLVVLGAVWIENSFTVCWINKNELLGKTVGIFVASGGLGYFLANIYFALRRLPILNKLLFIDHARIIKALKDKIEIIGPNGKAWNIDRIKFFDAWSIMTHYSVSQQKKDKNLAAIVSHTEPMVDVTHGVGAFAIGTSLTMVVYLIKMYISPNPDQIRIAFIILIILSVVLWFAFHNSLRALESVSNTAFQTSIFKRHKKINSAKYPSGTEQKQEKITIYYDKNDKE
ncbi:hypothetical protein ACFL1N_16790 [Thermodesulfobacteriota bacterium]